MRVQVMIYMYGTICACMIVFNLVYSVLLKRSEPKMKKRCQKLKKELEPQLERIRNHEEIQQEHLNDLQHKLKHLQYLIAFDRVLDEIRENQPELGQEYLHQIRSVILYMASLYRDRDKEQASYFAYFISRHGRTGQMPVDALQEMMLDYVKKDNLYCRVNALNALYHFAGAEHMVSALKIQDDGKVFLHDKIITEGLLTFSGDHQELIDYLWEEMDAFSEHTQLAILNYIRFQSGDYQKEMFAIMQDEEASKELRLSAIRYFGKYYYEPALEPLLAFVQEKDPVQWEFATIAVSSLSRYPGQLVIDTLKEALYSGNWYIRYAAAQSLEAQQVGYSDLIDIVMGNDRYAREMMTYRLESRELQHMGV